MIENGILKCDDLHWCEEENKFVPLSMDELDKLIIICGKNEELGLIEDFDQLYKVIQWAEQIRIGELLLKGLLEGRLGAVMMNGMEEPTFYETSETIDEATENAKNLDDLLNEFKKEEKEDEH